MAKNKPPKGDNSAFLKHGADAYYEYAKSLDDAAKAEDKAKAQAGAGQDRGVVQGVPLGPQDAMRSSSDSSGTADPGG